MNSQKSPQARVPSAGSSLLVRSDLPSVYWKDHVNEESEVLELQFPVSEELTRTSPTPGSFSGVRASS